jgi:hypothetical protein
MKLNTLLNYRTYYRYFCLVFTFGVADALSFKADPDQGSTLTKKYKNQFELLKYNRALSLYFQMYPVL